MKKRNLGVSLLALLAALALILPVLAVDFPGWLQGPAGETSQRAAAVTLYPQSAGEHIKYMTGSGGWFNPEQPVTRAELAQMLDRVVADVPDSTPSFYDVPWNAWYAPAVQKAAGLGLMTSSNGAFRPDDPATRAECAAALSAVLPYDVTVTQSFSDVPPEHWAWYAISRTASYGLFHGDGGGYFRPDDGLKRCEVVAVFNRLLDRTPDTSYISHHSGLPSFPDVPATHWAYADIMEATITHQCSNWLGAEIWTSVDGSASVQPTFPVEPTLPVAPSTPEPVPPTAPVQPSDSALSDGPQRIDGHLYWVVNGQFARSQSISGLYFDENGWYSTGNTELDGLLNSIVDQVTNDSMTRDQKLRALFDYTVNNYKYLTRPLVKKGAAGWEPDYALFFLKNGKGNCFSFAAAYCLLCRELGLPAYTVVGASGNANSPHGWVEMVLDGTVYMFDPELQWYYNNKTAKKVNLFKMQPSKVPAGVYRYIW